MVNDSFIRTFSAPCFLRSLRSTWFMALALFVAGMILFTAHNNFRFYYHPDEKGKVRQIADHTRNCNHPLMMLTLTNVATQFHRGSLTSQEIVQTGRAVSAFFASLTAVAMALLARRMAGAFGGGSLAAAFGGWCTGAFLLTDARMFDLAHYMKEDPALVMGLALTFLALHLFWTRRDDTTVILAGIATATAVSGKYVGWLLFPFAIGIILWGFEPTKRKRMGLLFLKSFGAVWAILNYSIFFDPSKPFQSISAEMKGVVGGHHGLTKDIPHAAYVKMFLSLPLAITSLFGLYLVGMVARIKKTTPAEWLVPGFTLLLMVMMSFSPKSSSRYFLPVEMVVCFGAGLGLVWSASWLSLLIPRHKQTVLALTCVLLSGVTLWKAYPVLELHYRAMTLDDRNDFKAWIAQNLPSTAVIAEDGRVHLPAPDVQKYTEEPAMPQQILHAESAADLGTLEELRAKNVTHVAIDCATFLRYDTLTPNASKQQQFRLRKAFYASLGVLQNTQAQPGVRQVWASPLGINIYLQPGIQLFDISAVKPGVLPDEKPQ